MPSRIFPGRQNRPDWNNLNCRERNRFPRHAYMTHYPDQLTCENALDNNRRYLSPHIQLLNGSWDYKLFETVAQMPENIFAYRTGFDAIEVPASYSISRLVQRKHHQVLNWPFPVNPPYIPEDIPVGVYHRCVQFEQNWGNLRKRLVFHGVMSAYHVVVNGRIAGYAQNGLMTHEFDVTSLVHDGVNELFVLVYPFSAASYLDDAGFGLRSGIVGDVYIEAVSTVSLVDLAIQTTQLKADVQAWNLALDINVISYRVAKESLHVRITLKKDGELLSFDEIPLSVVAEADGIDHPVPSLLDEPYDKAVQRVLTGSKSIELDHILPWSDETPELYDLFLTCVDAAGREYGCVHQSVGFRELKQIQGVWQLNGQPLKLFAIRYQPQLNAFPNRENLSHHVRELRMIRQQHLNTVVLPGMAIDPLFFELCNHFGVFVIQDNGIGTLSKSWLQDQIQPTKPISPKETQLQMAWEHAIDDRITSQIHRDQNQACLLGHVMADSIFEWVKSIEQRSIDSLTTKFTILDQAIDLLGAGPGDLSKTLEAIQNHATCAGLVCGHWETVRNGAHSAKDKRFAGSLGVLRASINALSIQALDLANGVITIQNKQKFQNLQNIRLHWQVLRNGILAEAGELNCPELKPRDITQLTIEYGPVNFRDGATYRLQVIASVIDATLWQTADSIILTWDGLITAANDFRDPYLQAIRPLINGQRQKLRLDQDRHLLVVSGPRFWIVFNRISAMLESWRCGDQEWLAFAQTTHAAHRGSLGQPIIFWRPSLAQDSSYLESWLNAGLNQLVQTVDEVTHTCDGAVAEIVVQSRYGPIGQKALIQVRTIYKIADDGQMTIQADLLDSGTVQPEWLPRFGFRLFLRKQYDRVIWSGLGPDPAWPGHLSTNLPGQYVQALDSMMSSTPLEIKEYAPHAETNWLSCIDQKGNGLLIENSQPFSFQVRDYVLEDIAETGIETKQLHQNLIELCLDFYYKPVGKSVQNQDEASENYQEKLLEKSVSHAGFLTLTPSTGFPPV
ncbi:MAG: DUF4981 domain-containing protein [Eubacteriales bacterium]|nr:DUF4981 domain-containing protein [Eubacteriales bacterium]